jgi:outer membrane protein OmpA-like peptidoglycan-associated protein
MKIIVTLIFVLLFFQIKPINSQQLENLGPNINTENFEIVPVISPDGKTLYFKRHIGDENNYHQEQWYSELDESGNWKPAVKMENPFGPDVQSFGINSITPDGNKILVSQFVKGDKSKTGLFFYYKTVNGWGNPEKLQIAGYNRIMLTTCWTNYFLSNSGKVLLMSFSENSDCIVKRSSIYISFLLDSNKWSEPEKLGAPINVDIVLHGDAVPFLASDDKTMYFSSDRAGGYGNADIYMSRRLDDTWLKWSEPENLGEAINSSGWDAYYTISAKGDYAYVVSGISGYGESDIFRIELPGNLRPQPVVLISGRVLNADTKQPIDAEISYYTLPDGIEAGIARTNPSNHFYKIVLPYGKQYSFIATATGYYSISNYLDLSEVKEYKEMNIDIEVKPIEVGESIRLNNIFFDFNKSFLRPESYPELDRVVKMMNDNPSLEIELGGHTDNIGSAEYNYKLSDDRANSVLQYILSKGISSKRLSAKGYGKDKPVATNDTDEGRQLNRRVEFTIIKK